jgi:hypothetical protein
VTPIGSFHVAAPSEARLQRIAAAVLLAVVLLPSQGLAYGFSVHRLVNRAATTHLPASFSGFAQWADDLEALSTAPDERKCCVPGESIKHYIDIDDYPEFFTGTLPHEYADMLAQYDESRVLGNGTVPWAIVSSYADLVAAFTAQDWTTAVATAADIGHYVADSHNPMHLTVNYNGQLTEQYGIHSRHESEMTSRHLAELVPAPGMATLIPDPLEAVFDWIDAVYPGVEQILAADLVAKEAADNNTSSDTYYDRLWLEIGPETTAWLRDASLEIASLWYSAWVEAGSPAMPGDPSDTDHSPRLYATRVLTNVPNPFNPTTQLRFELGSDGPATLRILDAAGRLVRRMALADADAGFQSLPWDGTDDKGMSLSSGVYYIVVTDRRGTSATGSATLLK